MVNWEVKDPAHALHLLWLEVSLQDPRKLLELHDELRGTGRPKKDLEVLKRSSVILTVTSWETFIETVLESHVEDRLRSKSESREVLERLRRDLGWFNTPNSRKIRRLFREYAKVEITGTWRWPGMRAPRAQEKLDDLVRLRGKLTHRARSMYEQRAPVRLKDAVGAIELVERLAHCTVSAL